jgi:hypothetical protein
MNEYANEWISASEPTNEYTGLHPVLGYFAPSGLGGLMHYADNYTANARIFAPRG